MTENPENPQSKDAQKRTFTEVFEVTGSQLIDKIKDLIHHGNIRKLRLHAGDDFAVEMPVTVGAIAGGVVVLAAPWLAVIGVIAAMVTKVQIEVERDEDAPAKAEKTPESPVERV